MAIQLSVAVRNGRLDAIETVIGTAPTLEIRTGAAPSDCASPDSGTLLSSMTLPTDWLANGSSGSKVLSGTWEDPSANASGVAGHFRIKQSTTCHIQGSVTAIGGGGDLTLDNTNIASGQTITITSFTLTDGNA